MAKKIQAKIKLNLKAGEANPGPPAGPVLGQYGVPIMDFINQYNEATKEQKGDVVPVEITVYEDRSFTFITKSPPVADLIKKKLSLEKGSGETKRKTVGKLSKSQVKEIVEEKLKDLNTSDLGAAERIVEGTAKSMGVQISD